MSRVADTTLYDDLGVRPGASDTEIRKVGMYRDRQMSHWNVFLYNAPSMLKHKLFFRSSCTVPVMYVTVWAQSALLYALSLQ